MKCPELRHSLSLSHTYTPYIIVQTQTLWTSWSQIIHNLNNNFKKKKERPEERERKGERTSAFIAFRERSTQSAPSPAQALKRTLHLSTNKLNKSSLVKKTIQTGQADTPM